MSETLHAEAPLANSPEARNPNGSLKDQNSTTQTQASTGLETTTEAVTDKTKSAQETTSKVEEKKGKESLLNAKDEAPSGAPEKYDAFKAPEGVTLNPDVMTKAGDIFKGLNLNQDQAQSLVDLYVESATSDMKSIEKVYQDQRAEWQTKTKADPEIGSKLTQVRHDVSKALDAALGPTLAVAFKKALDDTGVGDHPDFIKGMYKLSPRWLEGTHVGGKGPAETGQLGPNAKPKSIAQAMYPNLPSSAG